MTPNVSFALLDAAVIAGRGEDPVLETGTRVWSHARLLEEVAAMGGVLRHLGIGVGVPCVVALEPDVEAVVAALATARVGGVVTTEDDPAAPAVVVSAGSSLGGGRTRLVRGAGVEEPDLEWDLMLRAGRTDPAACEVLDPGAAYAPGTSVGEQIAELEATSAPYAASELRRLLRV